MLTDSQGDLYREVRRKPVARRKLVHHCAVTSSAEHHWLRRLKIALALVGLGAAAVGKWQSADGRRDDHWIVVAMFGA